MGINLKSGNPTSRLPRRIRTRKILIISAGFAAAFLAAAALHLLDGPPAVQKPDIRNVSGRATACLASDSTTFQASPAAADVWTALRNQGAARNVNVQQLVTPVETDEQAATYLAGLTSRHCNLIVTIGERFNRVAPNVAETNPGTAFTAIESKSDSASSGKVSIETQESFASTLTKTLESLSRPTR
ncbi:BMP family ABC transporter substrate-binding protein [Kitasatospora griseola]|uniref:BMP family ABC transporter substrate-binding protein n=1 Tax=Kitasatospora griseola TaxID=2064 RepID=UPI00166FD584|nr:BMP family ABC transporter substrate-binding protein [Kitasatospora griseola]GGR07167.1 hypothetical protein GCM10010195_72750 [Kitasatospora griseola]